MCALNFDGFRTVMIFTTIDIALGATTSRYSMNLSPLYRFSLLSHFSLLLSVCV